MSELSKYALMVAKKIAHDVWDKYDDTYGYRTEKQTLNEQMSTDDPENIWFFWNQFDYNNQQEFYELATIEARKTSNQEVKKLKKWAEEQLKETKKALEKMEGKGIPVKDIFDIK